MVAGPRGESLREKARRRASELGIDIAPVEPPKAPEFDSDLIPEIEPYERSEDDLGIDAVLDALDIVDAYNRWANKGPVGDAGDKRESVMIRCPNPEHPDRTPSAWLNLDKQVWHCGACDRGGDKFDIAAWHFGYPVPEYKIAKTFPELRRRMAEALGYTIKRSPTGTEYVSPPVEDAGDAEDGPDAPIVELPHEDPEEPIVGHLDWESIVPDGSFLADWMDQVSIMDVPDSYLFFNGLIAVAFAAGNDVVMPDFTDVKANLNLVHFGGSGTGKSRSIIPLTDLLREALPYDPSDPHTAGVLLAGTPSSAESMVDAFSKELLDDDGKPAGWVPIRGLVKYSELSELISKSNRMGSALRPTLMEFFDAHGPVVIRSRGMGTIRAENPFCQVITTTQVKSTSDLLRGADADSGFLNRWVFVLATRKTRIPLGGKRVDVSPLVDPLRRLRAWASTGRQIKLDEEGSRLFTEWFYKDYIPLTEGENEEVLIQRCDLLIKKLIVIFAVNSKTEVADAKIVQQALALWPYLREAYGVLRQRLGVVATEEAGDAILAALKEFKEVGLEPTARDLYARKLRRKFRDKEVLIKALSQLKALGLIDELISTQGKTNRTVVRYRLLMED